MNGRTEINSGLHITRLIPVAGIFAFVILYFISATLYPGGSQFNHSSDGFSWFHNYWCNLLAEKGINGHPNPGRLYAFAAFAALAVALSVFWMRFFAVSALSNWLKVVCQAAAVAALSLLFFLFTGFHDVLINIAGLLGLLVLFAMYIVLYSAKWLFAFRFGLFVMFLVLLNNVVYYSGNLFYLPVIQKITTVSFLFWILYIHLKYHVHLPYAKSMIKH